MHSRFVIAGVKVAFFYRYDYNRDVIFVPGAGGETPP